MGSIISSDMYTFRIDGNTIRIDSSSHVNGNMVSHVGIVSILPKVQIAIGEKLDTFLDALELSRVPLMLKKTMENDKYETYDIIRMETGSIKEKTISTISVYGGIMVGITYSGKILEDKQFRKMVKLTAMQQITIGTKGDKLRLFNATNCISKLTRVDRDKLIAVEMPKSIRVRAPFKSKYNLPLYYIFTLDKVNKYRLTQVSFDFNEIANRINN